MKKVLTVFGTRPEAIKMAPVLKALESESILESRVAVTGQHREMLDQALQLFEIIPDYDLELMSPGQTLNQVTSGVLVGIESILDSYVPDLVLVHGDTTTTMSAAMAAFYKKIPVAHVEAGLRTHDIYSPWPEELNRKIAGAIATLHFAPTAGAEQNLLREGVPKQSIIVTGNTVVDALLEVVGTLESDKELSARFDETFAIDAHKKLILVTGHRRENFGEGLQRVCTAIERLALRDDVQIIFPVHLNPNVKKPVEEKLRALSSVSLTPPQDYLPFVHLMRRSHLIVTDSGGIQEEAPSIGKPVLVTRDHSERPEAIKAGTVKLVGTSVDLIVNSALELLDREDAYSQMVHADNPYGDGLAATRICRSVIKFLGEK